MAYFQYDVAALARANDDLIEDETRPIGVNQLAFVPAGTRHNFKNSGGVPLRLRFLR